MSTLLLVEDDEYLLRAMQRWLCKHYTLLTASSLAAALPALAQADILLTDWHLGDDDGLTLIEHAYRRFPLLRCVLMTATALDTRAAKRLARCRGVFLAKPFDFDDLRRTLGGL